MKNGKGKEHIAEDLSHSNCTDPEESPGEDPAPATVAAAVNPCAEEATQANSETDVPVQPGNGGPQV